MARLSRLLTSVRKQQKGSLHDDPRSTSIPSPDGSDASSVPELGPLKGRKRFSADLNELKAHPESIPQSGQWSVKCVKAGDEEASLEITLVNATEGKVQTITLLVSDSSQYPGKHTYFGYSQDSGALESDVARVIDKLPMKVGCTLREVVWFFIEGMSRGAGCEADDGSEEDDVDGDDFMILDDDYEQLDRSAPSQTASLSLGRLMKDFVEVKEAGYNPGILWTGSNTFILSVSLPVPDLFQRILPHALFAWDRHFLEPGLHLTLLIFGFNGIYPALQQDGKLSQNHLRIGSTLKFKVGFTQNYKPSSDNAANAFREFFLGDMDKDGKEDTNDNTSDSDTVDVASDLDAGAGSFRRMSLSTPLETLLDQQLLRLLQLRKRFNLGWAGAEELSWQSEIAQEDPASIFQQKQKEIEIAESNEKQLSESNTLPSDPVDTSSSELNLLKIAFVFLLRRLTLSTQHCVVCYKKLPAHDALRPYVCSSGLCVFQYYSLNLGPSIEHEIITNMGGVDLLVSFAYVAAAEGVLDEPLPCGMGLRVPRPTDANVSADDNGLCEFDSLKLEDMRKVIAELLSSLPPIKEMKEYLQRQISAGNTKARVKDMDPTILPAAWSTLMWCVASCTAHIQELTEPEDRLSNLGKYRQFRFLVGAPDKEKKFLSALPEGEHPAAFHGSPLRNWHSIIRHGLWVKAALNGRSHGNGVYFCQDASVSLSSYAQPSSTVWKHSMIKPTACCTLAELVNRRQEFVYNGPPYFVVGKTEWIMCRYLLVQTATHPADYSPLTNLQLITDKRSAEEGKSRKYLKQERNFCTRLGSTNIDIPQPSYQIDKLVRACISERNEISIEDEDKAIFDGPKGPSDPSSSREITATPDTEYESPDISDEAKPSCSSNPQASVETPPRPLRAWKPDDKWIERNAMELLPPPTESSVTATVALRRELRSMMREQSMAIEKGDLGTLGWYLPPQHNENNLYQWLVELHSFDPDLPIAKDMVSKDVASIAMEIRFLPSFPHAPPFFRVIRPRFRPFMQGGGGHVTLGGSICMDLLTSDGWLPSYCVSAVLLQIKIAMASTTPYPARLQHDWDRAYAPEEALTGYIRAASIHNWRVKNEQEIRRLVTAK